MRVRIPSVAPTFLLNTSMKTHELFEQTPEQEKWLRNRERMARRAARAGPVRIQATFQFGDAKHEIEFETHAKSPEGHTEWLEWKKNPSGQMPDWLAEELGEWESDMRWELMQVEFTPL